MTYKTSDVVVIGGGVIGTSIAMHLARMGAGRVLLVEKGYLASGTSGRSGAMVREHYLHPVLVRMAMESSGIFHNFGEAVGGDARFIQTGRLLLFAQHDMEAARANVAMNRELVHGAYALGRQGIRIIWTDTLQIANLDLNELEGSFDALSLAVAEHGDQLVEMLK